MKERVSLRVHFSFAVYAVLLFWGGPGVQAETDDPRVPATATADTVVVQASRLDNAAHRKIPGTVNVVDAESIGDYKPTDATEVLRRVPGVNYIDEDGRGFKPNIGIRGLDPNRSRNVLLLLDGFPIQPSSYGDPAAYFNVPIEDIERIDVVKGPSTLLYHTNALGGVVNYISKAPPKDKKWELTNQETFGEDSLFSSQTALGGTVGDLSYRTSYLRRQGEGFRESDAFGIHEVANNLIYQLNDQSSLRSNTYWYYEDSDTPGGLSRSQYDADHLQSQTPDDNFEGRRVHTNLTYRNEFADRQAFESYFYYTFFSRDWFIASTRATGNQQIKRDFNVFGFGSKYELDYDLFGLEDNQFTLGTDYYFDREEDLTEIGPERTSRHGQRTGDNDLTTFAFDFHGTTKVNVTERLSVAPVLRVDFVRNGLENNIADSGDSNISAAWSPGAGAEYRLWEETSLYASFHRSFQPAEYREAVNPTTGTSSDLDAQRGTHYEIGFKTEPKPWINFDLALFTFDFDNQIITESGVLTNGQNTRHSGIENSISLALVEFAEFLSGSDIPDYLGYFSTNFNYTLLDTDFRKGPTSGNELPYAPNWQFNWGLHYDHPSGFYANLNAQWVDEQYSSGNNTRIENAAAATGIIPSYKVWDFNAGYDFNDRFGIFFGVKNIFDEKYFTRRDTFFTGITPSPDRQVYFGTKFKLG